MHAEAVGSSSSSIMLHDVDAYVASRVCRGSTTAGLLTNTSFHCSKMVLLLVLYATCKAAALGKHEVQGLLLSLP